MSFPNIEHDVEEHWDVHLAVPITAPEASALVFYCNNSSQNYEKGKCYLLPCALAISQFRCVIGVCNTYEVISIPFMSIAKWKVSRATHHVINELQSLIASSSSSLSSQSSSTNTNNYANRDYSSCAYVLTLHTKHVFTYHILLQHEMIVRNIKSMLNRYASIACVQEMPAFEYCRSKVKLQNNHVYNKEKRQVDSSSETDYTVEHKSNGKTLTDELEILMATEEFGWNIYSPEVEYARQLNGLFMLSSHPETLSEEHQEEEEKEDNEDNEKEVLERMMEENAIDVISVTNTDRKEDERDKVKSHCDVRHKFHFISLYNNSSPTNEEIRQIPESFSPSYPPYVLTPRSITLPQIIADLTARSRGRVLNVSFVHGVNGALLIRAAQPLLRSSNIYVDAMMCREFMKREYTTILYNHSNKNCIEVKGNTVTHVNHTSTSSLNTSKQHLASQPPPSLFDDDDDDNNSGSKQMQEYSNDNANGNKVVNVHEQESQNNSNINITKNSTPAESHIIKKASQEQILQEKSQNKSNAAGVENNSNATTMDSNSGSVNNHCKDKMAAASTLFVADCRPSLAANANAQLGGGFESGTFYNFARLFFYNIDNIFAMKKSLVKIRELIREYAVESDKEDFYKDLHSSKWLTHIQRILKCGAEVSHVMQHNNESALVHCTDGWDRTAEIICVAMILLDPFYRTVIGFASLIEKEFVQCGHKLAERNEMQITGRGLDASAIAEYNQKHFPNNNKNNDNNTKSKTEGASWLNTHIPLMAVDRAANVVSADTESSNSTNNKNKEHTSTSQDAPIFLQFLDVVYQIMHQFPCEFEFTSHVLSYLAEAAYSGLYGTFLCNSDYERLVEGVKLNTCSVWTQLLRRVQLEKRGQAAPLLVNTHYNYEQAWMWINQKGKSTERVNNLNVFSSLLPINYNSSKLVFWSDFYFRHDYYRYTNMFMQQQQQQQQQQQKQQEKSLESSTFQNHHSTVSLYNIQKESDNKWPIISWGKEYDAYLNKFIYLACLQRCKEKKALERVEKLVIDALHFSNINNNCNNVSKQLIDKKASQDSVLKSKWCEFDHTVCYNCYKPFSMWGGKTMCAGCKQLICADCVEHDCTM